MILGADDQKALDQISEHIKAKLNEFDPGEEVLELLAAQLSPLWTAPVATINPGRSRPAHIASLRVVVRDEDLKVLDAVLDGLKASAGAGFFLHQFPLASVSVAVVGVLASVLKLLYNAYLKGATLTPEAFSVVAMLMGRRDGLTIEQIVGELATMRSEMDRQTVAKVLDALSGWPCPNGKIVLVWQSGERWRTTGV